MTVCIKRLQLRINETIRKYGNLRGTFVILNLRSMSRTETRKRFSATLNARSRRTFFLQRPNLLRQGVPDGSPPMSWFIRRPLMTGISASTFPH